mgnify:CR=1 FL=1
MAKCVFRFLKRQRRKESNVSCYNREHDVQIHYKNHRGEISIRLIRPEDIFFGSTQWHPEPQWIINAYDYGKEARRSFAIGDIAFWTFPVPPRAGTAAK